MLENVQGRSPNLIKLMEQKQLEKRLSPGEAYKEAWGKPLEYDLKDYTITYNRLDPVYKQAIQKNYATLEPDHAGIYTLTITNPAGVTSLLGQHEQLNKIKTAQARSLDSWGNILEQEMG